MFVADWGRSTHFWRRWDRRWGWDYMKTIEPTEAWWNPVVLLSSISLRKRQRIALVLVCSWTISIKFIYSLDLNKIPLINCFPFPPRHWSAPASPPQPHQGSLLAWRIRSLFLSFWLSPEHLCSSSLPPILQFQWGGTFPFRRIFPKRAVGFRAAWFFLPFAW